MSYSDLLEGFDPDGARAAEPAKEDADEAASASGDNTNTENNTGNSNNTVTGKTTHAEAKAFVARSAGTPAVPAADSAPDSKEDTNNAGDAGDAAEARNASPGSASDETKPKTAIGTVLGALADSLPPKKAPEPPGKKPKKSPARRRADLQKRVTALRGMARTRRAALAAERQKQDSDADVVRALEAELDSLDKQLGEAEDELTELMERAARRADRDRDLRNLEKDPATGKKWAREYEYDPRRDEMQRLYAHKTHPSMVFEDGGKLIRADGGKYGREGGIVRALLDGAARAGETLSPRLLHELTKSTSWDLEERVYGMGSGYCRDAAWVLYLWCQATDETLDLSKAPKRKLPPDYDKWVRDEFNPGYAEALSKLGLVEPAGVERTAADTPSDVARDTAEADATSTDAASVDGDNADPDAADLASAEVE